MLRAAAEGVTVAALTDHDTLAGIGDARAAARSVGIELIPGIELSVDHDGVTMHMLVYFTEPGPGPIQDELAALRAGRRERNAEILERLNELGYDITAEDVARRAAGPSVGRPHIADALIAAGYFTHRNEVFEHLLHDGGPAYVHRLRLSAERAIALARDAGAVPIVAHPATIPGNRDTYRRLFRDLTEIGLGGIEAHHSMHDPALRAHLEDLAHDLGIAATGGSDYHGATTREYRIRVGTGDLRVPERAVEELEAQRGK